MVCLNYGDYSEAFYLERSWFTSMLITFLTYTFHTTITVIILELFGTLQDENLKNQIGI